MPTGTLNVLLTLSLHRVYIVCLVISSYILERPHGHRANSVVPLHEKRCVSLANRQKPESPFSKTDIPATFAIMGVHLFPLCLVANNVL